MANDPQQDFTGVGDTPDHLKFDESSLHAYMEANVQGFQGPITVEKI